MKYPIGIQDLQNLTQFPMRISLENNIIMVKYRIYAILFCVISTVNVIAQKTYIPIDSVPEELKGNIYFEPASKGDPEALVAFSYACFFSNQTKLGLSCLEQASDLGNSNASVELAGVYCFGLKRGDTEHMKPDSALAMHYFQLALEQDITGHAHTVYGNVCANGSLFEKNIELAKKYWEKASEMGSISGEIRLAMCYFSGEYGEKDYKEAKKWIDKVLANPDTINGKIIKSVSRNMLAEMYEQGLGVEQNYSKAFKLYLSNSNWMKVAECYDKGNGVKKNKKKAELAYQKILETYLLNEKESQKALDWMEKNINTLKPSTIYAMGEYYAKKARHFDMSLTYDYRKGTGDYKSFDGLSPHYSKAIEYWEMAAQADHIEAIKKLVDSYLKGIGVEKDSIKATEWVREGARKSEDKDMLFMMAWHNAKGIGTPINEKEAVKWYKKAVEAGNISAATNLGWCYENGFGCEVDYRKAAKYYTISAEHGEALGLNNIGFAYLQGKGVEKDYNKGISFIQKAIQKGRVEKIPFLYRVFAYGWLGNTPNLEKGAEVFRALDDSLNNTNEECLFYLHHLISAKPEVASDSTELIRRYTLHLKKSRQKKDIVLYNFQDRLINCIHTTSKDFSDAINFLRTESKHGNTNVKYTFYQVLKARPEVAKDTAEVINLLRNLAESGHAESQFQMAWSYAKGLGVEIDSAKAVSWYTIAAQNEHPAAAFYLAWCYDNAFGCTADPSMALKWYKKADELGYSRAAYVLGRKYFYGIDADKNIDKGLEYLTRSASFNGDVRDYAIAIVTDYYWKNKDYKTLIAFCDSLENKCEEFDIVISFYRAMAMLKLGKSEDAFQELSGGWHIIKFMKHANSVNELVDGKKKILLFIDNDPYIEYLPGDLTDHLDQILIKYNIPKSDFQSITYLNNKYLLKTKTHTHTSSGNRNLVRENSPNEILFEMYRDYAYLLYNNNIMKGYDICDIAFDKALECNSKDINLLNTYAYKLCINGGNLEKALSMSQQTIDNSPNEPYYLDTYAWILYQMKKYPEAKIFIDRCMDNIRQGDDNFEIFDHAGDIYFMNKKVAMAINMWKKAKESAQTEYFRQLIQQKIDKQCIVDE